MRVEGFSRAHRIRDAEIFRTLISSGAKLATAFFFIRHRANDLSVARIGIVVPKKNFRRVVDRNRLKRMARESFRRAQSALPAHDFLLYYLNPAGAAEPRVLAQSLRESWARISK